MKLLYNLPDYDMDRRYFIVVYKENDLYGLYDLLFNEKITEAIYNEFVATHLGDPSIRINDKYGVVHFTYEEDEDYEAEHIIANPSSIIFQKITPYENLFSMTSLFTLPNGYRCFGKFNTETSKYNYFLPKEIKDRFHLF